MRGRAWTTIVRLTTDSHGYWSRRVRLVRGAAYRFVTADGPVRASAARSGR